MFSNGFLSYWSQVVGEAQGSQEAVASFLKELDKGPKHAHVVRLDKEEMSAKSAEHVFEIQ